LELEPGLSSRVIKAANSALFGTPRSITSLKAAVVRLGNQNVARLALAAGLTPAPSPLWATYWSHSLAVALLARHMAAFQGKSLQEQEEFFSMGLLHDLGVLLEIAAGPFQAVEKALQISQDPLSDVESRVLGFTHAEAGGVLAGRWNFPGDLVHAIAFHHQPEAAGDYYPIAAIVHLADLVCHGFELTLSAAEGPPHTSEAYLEELKIPVEQLVLFGEWLQERKSEITALGGSLAGG
jgi:HD-like signal output (HDOD) protein